MRHLAVHGRWDNEEENNLGMKKSSIDGNQYLDYLWELGEIPVYIYWWCWRFREPDSQRSVCGESQGIFTQTWYQGKNCPYSIDEYNYP
jgi:hypothetical protein